MLEFSLRMRGRPGRITEASLMIRLNYKGRKKDGGKRVVLKVSRPAYNRAHWCKSTEYSQLTLAPEVPTGVQSG